MENDQYRHWRVVQTVELSATSQAVWSLVGGFYNIHQWHPDIKKTEVPTTQIEMSAIRRVLTFPGQPKTVEELILMDNINRYYRYKWFAGEWGERVQNYKATLRVFDSYMHEKCIIQWSSSFDYSKDAVSDFYLRGFRALQKRFS